MSKVRSDDLAEATLSLRGSVQEDIFRIRSQGKKSFLEASSGNLRVRRTFPMQGKHWDRLLPFTAFEKIVKLFQGTVEIDPEEENLFFRDGKREISLLAKDAEDWVASPDWQEPQEIAALPGEHFRKHLRLALRSVSQDAGRPLLQTVALSEEEGGLSFVSTDSFRLLHLPLQGEQSASLPAPLLLEKDIARALVKDLQRVDPEEVWVEFAREGDSSGGIISYGTASWFFRSPDGEYPRWRDLLETSGPELRIGKDDILELLRFVEALQGRARAEQNGASALRLHLGAQVEASFQKPGLGRVQEHLRGASWPGEKETLGINPLFLRDMVEALDGETLRAQKSSSGGFVFRGRGDASYLLMPIRLPEEV